MDRQKLLVTIKRRILLKLTNYGDDVSTQFAR